MTLTNIPGLVSLADGLETSVVRIWNNYRDEMWDKASVVGRRVLSPTVSGEISQRQRLIRQVRWGPPAQIFNTELVPAWSSAS